MSIASSVRLALATLAVGGAMLAATAATSTPAEAGRRFLLRAVHVKHGHLRIVPRFIVPVATVAVVGGGCAVYRLRAQAYASPYWWARYKECKGYY